MNNLKKSGRKRYFSCLVCFFMISSGLGSFPYAGDDYLEIQDYFETPEHQDVGEEPADMFFREKDTVSEEIRTTDQVEYDNPDPIKTSSPIGLESTSTNLPPVADAGPNQNIFLIIFPPVLNVVHFDGSKSYDPDGVIAN